MNNSFVNTIDTGQGGTSGRDAIVNLIAEINLLYAITNGLHKLWKGPSPISGMQVGDVYINDAGAEPVLLLKTGEPNTWAVLGSARIFDSGLGLDAALAGYSRNCRPAKQAGSDTAIIVDASAAAPASIWINGMMLQNTGPVTASITSAGLWKIYATRNQSTSGFTIGARQDALTSGQVQIGEAYYGNQNTGDSDTARVLYCIAFEPVSGLDERPPGFFHYRRSTSAQTLASGVETQMLFNGIVPDATGGDIWRARDGAATYQTFRARRAGKYQLNASVRIGDGISRSHNVLLVLSKGRSPAVELARNIVQVETGWPLAKVSCEVELAAGDVVDVLVTQSCGATLDNWSSSHSDTDTAFWGRYLGAA